MNDAQETNTGAWTRHISRDLWPGRVTPYGWTLLAAAADDALRGAYRLLAGTEVAAGPLWRLADSGHVHLNAAAVAKADAELRGAAWLGPARPTSPMGLVARLQGGATVRRVQAALAAAMTDAPALHARLILWLDAVRALRWTQADLLQVMEELEPNASVALQTYLILRAGLPAAFARYEGAEDRVLAGARGLPTVDAVIALAEAARFSPDDPARILALDRYGHRGPGEIGPAAHRWADEPDLLDGLRSVLVNAPSSASSGTQHDGPRDLLALAQAADVAWDALTIVAAASQCWVRAAASEALHAGLIASPADVLFLELEELKQVATGEWHRGRSEAVQEQVQLRRAALLPPDPSAGQASTLEAGVRAAIIGPAYRGAPPYELPPVGAVWLNETPDPGCAPYWPTAGGLVNAAADPWSPGVIAARVMGVPCVISGGVI